MMKLSSSWPNGRMFVESDSGVTSRAIFSAEFSGGRDADLTAGEYCDADRSMISKSRAISSPDGSTGGRGGGGGWGTNSMRGCGVIELTAAVAVIIGSG